MNSKANTPMMRQYLAIKKDYPDSILFYRLGDFYEMFLEDAKIASSILQLNLTGRGKDENRIPMCGIPYHAKDNYIKKLIEKGHKVAICEQTEDANASKGLTKREVIRVITPGTVLNDHGLTEHDNNFLAAIKIETNNIALALLDYSTGDFFLASINNEKQLLNYLDICKVKELLIESKSRISVPKNILSNHVFMQANHHAKVQLEQFFKVKDLAGFGIASHEHCYAPAWALIEYVKKTQFIDTLNIKACKQLPFKDCLMLDEHSSKHLELFQDTHLNKKHSLFSIINHSLTPMGSRKLAHYLRHPLNNQKRLETRLDELELLLKNPLFLSDIRTHLSDITDIERLISKLYSDNQNPKDLCILKENTIAINHLISRLHAESITPISKLINKSFYSQELLKIATLIEKAIVNEPPSHLRDGGFIKPGFDHDLDKLNNEFKEIREWINSLESTEKEALSIKSLKVSYNKVFGYYIEIPKLYQNQVPNHYIRKQTLTNAERYITAELKEKEHIILNGQFQQVEREKTIYNKLLETLKPLVPLLLEISDHIATLDARQSLAQTSLENGYTRPQFESENGLLELEENKHPILAKYGKNDLISNTIKLDQKHNLMMLTGANMAGKSTLMRQAALTIILAQIGCFVPCKKARMSLTDRIFTRIGAADDLYAGQSTFMVEMIETANILHNATPNSFIILDEIGRGTSTYDGMSIAAAVIHDLQKRIKARCIFATHYHELSHYTHKLQGVIAYRLGVKIQDQRLVFTYLLEKGTADSSYGLTVAKMAGIPQSVLKEAQSVLHGLESKGLSHLALTKTLKQKPKTAETQLFLWQ